MWNLNNLKRIIQKWDRPKRKEIEEFLTRAREQAVMVESLDGINTDIEIFSIFDKLLENKRVVYLGEEDHWIHEKSDYRLLLLRYLISRGFRFIGEELGWSDGIRIDRYMEMGDEAHLEKIATYGYRGELRNDREDKATGILKSSNQNYPVSEFKREQLRLTRALRDICIDYANDNGRIHFFGFDIDAVAGGGYKDIEEILNPYKDEPDVSHILSLLSRVPGETLEAEINRLRIVSDTMNSMEANLRKLLGEKQNNMLVECVITLMDSFEFNRIANSAMNYNELNIAMAAREEVMYRHVKFILSRMKPTDKLVLMGHNRHLSKNIELINNVGASPPGGKLVPSIGTYINRLLPEEVFSIWQLHDRGSSSHPYTELSRKYESMPGSLNSVLAQIGSNYLLPTNGFQIFNKYMDIHGIYNAIYNTKISQQADAIFFIGEVSPLKL